MCYYSFIFTLGEEQYALLQTSAHNSSLILSLIVRRTSFPQIIFKGVQEELQSIDVWGLAFDGLCCKPHLGSERGNYMSNLKIFFGTLNSVQSSWKDISVVVVWWNSSEKILITRGWQRLKSCVISSSAVRISMIVHLDCSFFNW
jgi:hypothetical protein